MAISMRTLSDMLYIKGAISIISLIDIDNGYIFDTYIDTKNYCYRYFNILDIVNNRSVACIAQVIGYPMYDTPKSVIYKILRSVDIKPVAIEEKNFEDAGIGVLKISFSAMNESKAEIVLTEKECERIQSKRVEYDEKLKKYLLIDRGEPIVKKKDGETIEDYKYYISELKYDFSVDRSKPPLIHRTYNIRPKIYGKHGYSAGGFWNFIVTGDPWQRQ